MNIEDLIKTPMENLKNTQKQALKTNEELLMVNQNIADTLCEISKYLERIAYAFENTAGIRHRTK